MILKQKEHDFIRFIELLPPKRVEGLEKVGKLRNYRFPFRRSIIYNNEVNRFDRLSSTIIFFSVDRIGEITKICRSCHGSREARREGRTSRRQFNRGETIPERNNNSQAFLSHVKRFLVGGVFFARAREPLVIEYL